jgi:hypothetical protein
MRTYQLYTDTLHGLTAIAACKTCAWVIIKGKCIAHQLEAPEAEQVIFVRQLTEAEMIKIHNNAH